MRVLAIWLGLWVGVVPATMASAKADGASDSEVVEVRVPIDEEGQVDLAALVEELAQTTGLPIQRPSAVKLPMKGVAGALVRTLIAESLGSDASIQVQEEALVVRLPRELVAAGKIGGLAVRLRGFSERVAKESERRNRYGFWARESYRPNDPERPTVCLVHGLNSTSGSFVHMIPLLEEAGFGVVLYDFPDNQDLDTSAAEFSQRWREFGEEHGERAPWALICHSMGGLLARDYVEGDLFAGDVSDLILIGTPNQGAPLARAQKVLQLIEGTQAFQSGQAGALAFISGGLGASAEDMEPGSAFLQKLNARPRRQGVRYHILAGDAGFLPAASRRELEARLELATRAGGFLGQLARLTIGDLGATFDELSEGTGDGCVSVASTKLEGAPEPVVIHANHIALIRGPLLYPDPGPVVCMPHVLRWLEPLQPKVAER